MYLVSMLSLIDLHLYVKQVTQLYIILIFHVGEVKLVLWTTINQALPSKLHITVFGYSFVHTSGQDNHLKLIAILFTPVVFLSGSQ